MSRIVVVAATISGNHGAEAMLSAAIGRIIDHRPDLRVTVLSYYPGDDRALARPDVEVLSATPLALVARHLPGALLGRLLPRRWRESGRLLPLEVRRIADADVLIDLAGVSFIDGREKFLPFNILTVLAALVLGTPVVKLSQAIGPCEGWLMRHAAHRVLSRCARVFARGRTTRDHLEALGLSNVRLAPDVAFLLRDGDRLAAQAPDNSGSVQAWLLAQRRAGRLTVGICPSALIHQRLGDAYVELIAGLVRSLLGRGISILLFPNATRAGSAKPRNNDLVTLASVSRLFDTGDGVAGETGAMAEGERGRFLQLARRTDAQEIKGLFAALDLAVVSRFHAMVGALSTTTPLLVLGWGHKYREVMAEFGMQRFVIDAADAAQAGIDPQETLVLEALERRTESRRMIAARLPAIEAEAAAQIAYVSEFLPPPAHTRNHRDAVDGGTDMSHRILPASAG